MFFFFFFFQAEDGIRDADVTGVQTCALPICFFPAINNNGCFSTWLAAWCLYTHFVSVRSQFSTQSHNNHPLDNFALLQPPELNHSLHFGNCHFVPPCRKL